MPLHQTMESPHFSHVLPLSALLFLLLRCPGAGVPLAFVRVGVCRAEEHEDAGETPQVQSAPPHPGTAAAAQLAETTCCWPSSNRPCVVGRPGAGGTEAPRPPWRSWHQRTVRCCSRPTRQEPQGQEHPGHRDPPGREQLPAARSLASEEA